MKVLNIQGGGTKIIALGGMAITLLRDLKHEVNLIGGVSAGAFLSLPLALGKYDELENVLKTLTLDKMFDIKPFRKNGAISFRGLLRLLGGKKSIGRLGNARKMLQSIVSENEFNDWVKDENRINVNVCYVDFKSGKRELLDLSTMCYHDAIDAIIASASVPIFCEPIDISSHIAFDGGVRDTTTSLLIFDKYKDTISDVYTLYANPKNHSTKNKWDFKGYFKIYSILARSLDIMMVEVSKNDMLMERYNASIYNVNLNQIYMKENLTNDLWEIPKNQSDWFNIGVSSIYENKLT